MSGAGSASSAVACAALVTLALAWPPVATAAPSPAYYWRWSDGSRAAVRSFTDPGDATHALPRLIVTARPAVAGVPVELQFRDHGRWLTEDVVETGRTGAASLQLNPYCRDGGWCHATFDYRLVIAGQAAAVRVTYGR